MVVVVDAFDGRILDSAVHSLDLTVGPGMAGFGQAMFDIKISASHIERMATKGDIVIAHGFDVINHLSSGWEQTAGGPEDPARMLSDARKPTRQAFQAAEN